MMNIEPNKTVREVVLEVPGATRVFETVGIDYCCGGQRSLAAACASAGVPLEQVLTSLESTKTVPDTKPDFRNTTLATLIDHILSTHHVFTRTEIARIRALLAKVCTKHGENHHELEELRMLFDNLSAELEPHMFKEERVLFPYMNALEEAVTNKRPLGTPPFGTVGNPIRMMMFEHDTAGDLLKQMRELTDNYTTPPDGCISYQTLYQALDDFEKDLHEHIHLENNILFPRAAKMEASAEG
jgi:regulator of cell morphogenesis and NO signaling